MVGGVGPAGVAAQALSGIEEGRLDILADDTTRSTKQNLADTPTLA